MTMPTCRECKHWKPIPEETNMGDCFGHKVPGDLDVQHCPAHAFAPRN